MSGGKKRPVQRVLGGALNIGKEKIKTTVVKMTQSQFEDYLQSRATGRPGDGEQQQAGNKDLSSKQKAATGPFLAYVNLCKPLLQAERPELSLLEVLKELASRWNGMGKQEKAKFATLARESEDQQSVGRTGVGGGEEAEGVEVHNSMEGAVFEVGESPDEGFYQIDKQVPEKTFYEINQVSDKSLNQNVFGKKVVLLNKSSEPLEGEDKSFVAGSVFHHSEDASLHVVESFDDAEQLLEQNGTIVQFEGKEGADSFETEVLQFGTDSAEKGTIIFDSQGGDGTVVFGTGSDMEIGSSTIFYLPNIVGEDQLEVI